MALSMLPPVTELLRASPAMFCASRDTHGEGAGDLTWPDVREGGWRTPSEVRESGEGNGGCERSEASSGRETLLEDCPPGIGFPAEE